jgi:hypothetical protein
VLSETGTRGTLTTPLSIASISAKSDTTQGNRKPSWCPEPQEEGRGRYVIHGAEIDFPAEGSDAVDPQPRGLGVLFCLLASLRLDGRFLGMAGLLLIAVVRFVVEDDDVLPCEQFRADARQHLPFRLFRLRLRPAALQYSSGKFRQRQGLAQLEGVVVGDDDARRPNGADHVVRHKAAALVIILRIARQQHAKAVADRDAGADDEKGVRIIPPAMDRIDRLPSNQHCQHGGLSGAGRHLGGDAKEARVVCLVTGPQLLVDGAILRLPCRDLLKPYDRLDGFNLTEEQRRLRLARPPMVEQPRRLVRHPRLTHSQFPPALQVTADLVDERVLGCLLGKGKAFLPRSPRLRNRDQINAAPTLWLYDRSERAALVQSPVTVWRRKRRVEDRVLRG